MDDDESPLGAAAALQIGFSTGMGIALILHAFLVELYVRVQVERRKMEA